jgi:hypothetical protein
LAEDADQTNLAICAQIYRGTIMRIHVGCELTFDFPQLTPMIACLNVHFSRFSDLERPDYLVTNPPVPAEGYRDSFGNWCSRLVAPAGRCGDPG